VACQVQRRGRETQSLEQSPNPEMVLSARDPVLGSLIASSAPVRWPIKRTESAIWGLLRMVMAQQVSTRVAGMVAARVRQAYPGIANVPFPKITLDVDVLRSFGLPRRRAECCAAIAERAHEILALVERGADWKDALAGVKGIGPWTLAVFRILVLREPDVLPLGDVGLERAVAEVYGRSGVTESLAELWRPYRSVACWYLWRTLGNEVLG
jgi:DNA-3-methyladenine glycosylase II